MKKCDWNICRSAAVVAVLALSFAVRGGELLNCGKAKPENVILHTPEKRGQSVRIESLEQRDALRIDWDCARSGYFEFQLKPGVKLPEFRTAQIRVRAFIPEGGKSRNFNLRITDREGETFQFTRPLAAEDRGWREFAYQIDAGKPKAGSWGKRANRRIDFPAKLTGFASDFNSREGKGYLGIGAVEIEVLHSGLPLQPQLETGSPLQILTPERKEAPGISLVNPRKEKAEGELFTGVADAFGAELENATRKITLAPGGKLLFPLMKPKKFGVYYVDVRFRENDPQLKTFEKQYRYCYMRPAGPTPGMAKGFLFGVCSHPQGLSDRDLELEARAAALCGVKIMRTDIYWERIQPAPAAGCSAASTGWWRRSGRRISRFRRSTAICRSGPLQRSGSRSPRTTKASRAPITATGADSSVLLRNIIAAGCGMSRSGMNRTISASPIFRFRSILK